MGYQLVGRESVVESWPHKRRHRSIASFETIVRAANASGPTSVSFLFPSPCIMKPAHCEENCHKRTRTLALASHFMKKITEAPSLKGGRCRCRKRESRCNCYDIRGSLSVVENKQRFVALTEALFYQIFLRTQLGIFRCIFSACLIIIFYKHIAIVAPCQITYVYVVSIFYSDSQQVII